MRDCLFCQWLLLLLPLHCVVTLVVLGRLPFMLVSTPSGSEDEKEEDKSRTPISTRRRRRTRTRRRKQVVVVVVKKNKKKLKLELTLCFCWNRSWNKTKKNTWWRTRTRRTSFLKLCFFVLDPSFLWCHGKILEAWLFCLRLRFSFVFGFGEEGQEEEEQQQGRSVVVVVVGVHKVVKLLC